MKNDPNFFKEEFVQNETKIKGKDEKNANQEEFIKKIGKNARKVLKVVLDGEKNNGKN